MYYEKQTTTIFLLLFAALFVILQTFIFGFPLSLFQDQRFSVQLSSFSESTSTRLIIAASCDSLSTLVSQNAVIRTTQNLQTTDEQGFQQCYNEIRILIQTTSLRFPNVHFVFPITSQYEPVFSENYPQCLQHLFHG